ncbi:MAG: lysine--tRNA ligase [Candidatus Nanoarchaeia archaeon]|nr:lysine--tRNA ligase [Candidatus Nanoarchaeia archaeon]
MENANHLIQEKVRKLNEIRDSGINPYPYSYKIDIKSNDLKDKYNYLKEEEDSKDVYSVAGRIIALRRMGKATFGRIRDSEDELQLYFRFDDVGEEQYNLLKKSDVGDIVGVKGHVFKTKTGEITLYVESYEMLSKSIRPMPEKYHGIQDLELKSRKRYLDLITDPESRKRFKTRSLIVSEIRNWLNNEGFMEVETPILQPLYGGAAARPFVTHHNELKMDMYLKISPELYLKRLIVGGFDKVYDMNKNFRNEGVDKSHNPEFTMIEWYEAWTDYKFQMERFENLVSHLCKMVHGKYTVEYQGVELNFKPPWTRMTMADAIKKYADIDILKMDRDELMQYAIDNRMEYNDDMNKGHLINLIFEEKCEHELIQPTFITEHPIEISPLTKESRMLGKEFVERFEPFCFGMEIGNAYSELNDPIEQRRRLEEQAKARETDEEAHPMDEDFCEAIDYAMPPTGGVGLGVDRIVMLLTNSATIRDIILFPTMKKEEN